MKKLDLETISKRASERGLEVVEDLRSKTCKDLLFKCKEFGHEFKRTAGNMYYAENACPDCHLANRPNKVFKCKICANDFEASMSASSALLCSRECKDIYRKAKDESAKEEFFCGVCGKSKGFLHNMRVDGMYPDDRPCRDCSSKEVGLRTRGRKPWNVGVPLSDETKEKLRQHNLGRSPSNKGSTVPEDVRIKIHCSVHGISIDEFKGFKPRSNRHEFKELGLSKQCLERDNYTCQCCNLRGVKLEAHHKNSWKHFIEERMLLTNLVTLCVKCHKEFHIKYGSGCKKPNTEEQFNQFKREKEYVEEQVVN